MDALTVLRTPSVRFVVSAGGAVASVLLAAVGIVTGAASLVARIATHLWRIPVPAPPAVFPSHTHRPAHAVP